MVGRVTETQLAAVTLGNLYFFGVAVFGMGLLLALDPLVSQAYGAGDHGEIRASLQRGLVISLVLALATSVLLAVADPVLRLLGQPDEVVPIAAGYSRALIAGNVAVLRLRHLPAGIAGAREGGADRLDDRAGEPAQCLRELGPRVRQPWRPGDGCGRLGLGHRDIAVVHVHWRARPGLPGDCALSRGRSPRIPEDGPAVADGSAGRPDRTPPVPRIRGVRRDRDRNGVDGALARWRDTRSRSTWPPSLS